MMTVHYQVLHFAIDFARGTDVPVGLVHGCGGKFLRFQTSLKLVPKSHRELVAGALKRVDPQVRALLSLRRRGQTELFPAAPLPNLAPFFRWSEASAALTTDEDAHFSQLMSYLGLTRERTAPREKQLSLDTISSEIWDEYHSQFSGRLDRNRKVFHLVEYQSPLSWRQKDHWVHTLEMQIDSKREGGITNAFGKVEACIPPDDRVVLLATPHTPRGQERFDRIAYTLKGDPRRTLLPLAKPALVEQLKREVA